MKYTPISLLFACILFVACNRAENTERSVQKPQRLIPQIDGEWWQIAGDPDLGEYTTEKQQPVDFGIWQAADGTWQLWSCIRHTNTGGNTRLFYRWEGQNLRDTDWTPMGIAMEADTTVGEIKGGLQAPHVIQKNDKYYMFYGGWARICLAESEDGKTFTRILNEDGQASLFEGPFRNSRDAMVLKVNDLYYCYYTGHTYEDTTFIYNEQSVKSPHTAGIFCRTSANLFKWSEPMLVSAGGEAAKHANWYGGDAECPFVVEKNGYYYLFRNQRYGENNLNTQYASPNPMDFGVNDDRYMIGTLPVAAPEIIEYNGDYYIAALLPSLKGIRIARLKWVEPKFNNN